MESGVGLTFGFFVALWTFGSAVDFLFPCMFWSWFVASIPKVVFCCVRCRVCESGLCGFRVEIVFMWWVLYDCEAAWITGRDVCITIVPSTAGLELGVAESSGVVVCGMTGGGELS